MRNLMFFFKCHFFYSTKKKCNSTKLFIHSFFVFVQTLKLKHADAISSLKHFKTEWIPVVMIGISFLQLIKEIKSFGNINSVLCDMINPYLLLTYHMCGALCDLVPFAQFKKREKHPWRSVNFSCNFTKINTPP